MNKALLGLNVLLLAAVAVLYFLFFNEKKTSTHKVGIRTDSVNAPAFRVAYFEMDSVETKFIKAKEMKDELEKQQEKLTSERNRLQRSFQDRVNKLQQNPPTTQEQYDNAQKELAQFESSIKNQLAALEQKTQEYFLKNQQDILTMIRDFFTEYNKDKNYAYVIASEPGLVYYKDSTYNITADLIQGLNEKHKANKK